MSFISSPCYHYHNVAAFHVAPGVTYGLNRSSKRSLQTRDPSPAPTPNSQHARKKFASSSLRSLPVFGVNSAPVPLSATMTAIAPVETTPLHAHHPLMQHPTAIATAAEATATALDMNGMDVDVPGSVMA